MLTHDYPRLSQLFNTLSPQTNSLTNKTAGPALDYTLGRTAFGKLGQASSQVNALLLTQPAQIPALVRDPFDGTRLLDLTQASMPDFNLVDGTLPVATDPQMPFVLFKGIKSNTWFYAPRWARIATNSNGEPAFMITKKVHNNLDGSKTTVGGVLSFMIELVVDLPSSDQQTYWTQLIKTLYNLQPQGGPFNFQPLRLAAGKMDVSGLDTYARTGQALKGIDVGGTSSIGFAYDLTPDGADHFAAMVGAKPSPFAPQVAILCTFPFNYMVPQCQIQAHGFKKRAYDYFSASAKARASYFGLVNGSADLQAVRADLRSMQALDVSVVGTPPKGVDLQKLLDSVFDMFVKTEVGQWIQPDPKPIDTPAPGGFFGGVSVAMKDVALSDSAQFNETLNFAGISQDIFQVSFNFEQQVAGFDPAKHIFIEQDDIKLPLKLAIGNSDQVKVVIPSASYTTSSGPQNVQCNTVDGKSGGLAAGTIQYTWPDKPTSAQIDLLVNFDSSVGPGYEYRATQPVSDTGAAFLFNPDQFVQRTRLFFVMAATASDSSSKALFKWSWTPLQGGSSPRPTLSGFSLVAPDPANPINLPTYDIVFAYQPSDFQGESTPKIQYKIQGLTGQWKSLNASGTISIGETSFAVDWGTATSISETLFIPSVLTRSGVTDPAYRQRLATQYGQFIGKGSGSVASLGGSKAGNIGGNGGAPRGLGYTPAVNEPTLLEREMIARANLSALTTSVSTSYPTSYDLRSVNGQCLITPVRDQGYCGSCVAFGVCASVEGTLKVRRNDANLNPDFSEAYLFYCLGQKNGRSCSSGWWPQGALDAFQTTGVVDEACFPYTSPTSPTDPTPPCSACQDASNRATTISSWTVLSSTDDMKNWLSGGKGPLVAAFTIYQDFLDFFSANNDASAIYHKNDNPGKLAGGHCICVVGYSDDEQCWICKNSWSSSWAASGFFKIGYGEVGIDSYMWGVDIS